jgi:hypothetical protein
MFNRNLVRAGLTASACAVVGAGVGVAASAASPPHRVPASTTMTRAAGWRGWGGFYAAFPVHAEQTILDEAGTGYINQTVDDGTVSSLSGDQLAIKEGTPSMTYRTVTLSIPSAATVARDGHETPLINLRRGDFVVVRQSSDGTYVIAGDGSGSGWPAGNGHGGSLSGPATGGGSWSGSGARSGGWSGSSSHGPRSFPPFFGGA